MSPHLTPRDWQMTAIREAAELIGTSAYVCKMVEANRYKLMADELDAQAAQLAQIPAGMRLVPVEPTQAMCKSGHGRWQDWSMHSDGSPWNMNGYKAIYKAMIAAAPKE